MTFYQLAVAEAVISRSIEGLGPFSFAPGVLTGLKIYPSDHLVTHLEARYDYKLFLKTPHQFRTSAEVRGHLSSVWSVGIKFSRWFQSKNQDAEADVFYSF